MLLDRHDFRVELAADMHTKLGPMNIVLRFSHGSAPCLYYSDHAWLLRRLEEEVSDRLAGMKEPLSESDIAQATADAAAAARKVLLTEPFCQFPSDFPPAGRREGEGRSQPASSKPQVEDSITYYARAGDTTLRGTLDERRREHAKRILSYGPMRARLLLEMQRRENRWPRHVDWDMVERGLE